MLDLIGFALCNLICFALHVTNSGSFPKPLGSKQEQQYLEQMQNGDEKAREELIVHNLRLVAHVVKKYHNCTTETDDLISIGTIGLIKGISTFKPQKGTKLATYAAKCIENEILMHFRNLKKIEKDVYIDDPIDTDRDGNVLTLMDIISEETDIVEDIDTKMKSSALTKLVLKIEDERERRIIIERYGLFGQKEKTQNEIANELGISRSYVSRIEKKVLHSLRDGLNGKTDNI